LLLCKERAETRRYRNALFLVRFGFPRAVAGWKKMQSVVKKVQEMGLSRRERRPRRSFKAPESCGVIGWRRRIVASMLSAFLFAHHR
jgi:hypothetical protein